MKYPKHLILDLTPATPLNANAVWTISYTQTTALDRYVSTENTYLQALTFVRASSLRSPEKTSPTFERISSLTYSLFDIHFIRKEKMYTKLKYSRCPQYDIVSGGFAAIFAGFIGFLISEKFGIELVDSGDFYTAFMYGVFAAFSVRPLLRIYSFNTASFNPLSLKYALSFYRDLTFLSLSYLKSLVVRIQTAMRL